MGKGYRQGRLGEEIRRILSEMLINGIKDPRLAGKILSVSGVSVTRGTIETNKGTRVNVAATVGGMGTVNIAATTQHLIDADQPDERQGRHQKGNIQTSEGTPYTGVDLQDGSLHGLRQTY